MLSTVVYSRTTVRRKLSSAGCTSSVSQARMSIQMSIQMPIKMSFQVSIRMAIQMLTKMAMEMCYVRSYHVIQL